jgi:hypothetical protein
MSENMCSVFAPLFVACGDIKINLSDFVIWKDRAMP